MADFFEELGKKISDVASDIGKKTEDTIEIQKLKSNIRGLQRANDRDFIDIGRMVYEKFKDGEIVTNGGRVLGVTAKGKDLKEA